MKNDKTKFIDDETAAIWLYATRYDLQNQNGTFMLNFLLLRIAQIDTNTLKTMASDIAYIIRRRTEAGTTHRKEKEWLQFADYIQTEISRRG